MPQVRTPSGSRGSRLAPSTDHALRGGFAAAILVAGVALVLGWCGERRSAGAPGGPASPGVRIQSVVWINRSGVIRATGEASSLLQGTRVRLAAWPVGGDEYHISQGSHVVGSREPDPWELDVAVPLGSGLRVYREYRVMAFASEEPEWPRCLSADQFGRWRLPAASPAHSLGFVAPAPERPAWARIAVVALIVAFALQVRRRVDSRGVTWVALVLALAADFLPLSPHEQVPAAIALLAAANVAILLLQFAEARGKESDA